MRTLHELYCILWEEIKDKKYIRGLCCEIDDLYDNDEITYDERQLLKAHFQSQKPSDSQHADFTKQPIVTGKQIGRAHV